MSDSYCKSLIDAIHREIDEKYLFGHPQLIDLCMVAFLSRGHVLLEGPPGTGKTLTAKLLARMLAKSFKRIQFTSDMLPADIIGANIYSPAKQGFEFIPGPVFADFILADEINRTPPRTQSALLEAMEERQVTVEGKLMTVSPDFFVIATQNPQDFEGTFPLPEAQIDRFLFKLVLGHAPREKETAMLRNIVEGILPPPFADIPQHAVERARVEDELRQIRVDTSILRYIADILDKTRTNPLITLGSSVRGGIALAKCSRILALLRGRTHVVPDDIKELAVPTLAHRIRLTPEAQVSNVSDRDVIQDILKKAEFPS